VGQAEHSYDGRYCQLCSHGPCRFTEPTAPQRVPYREVCPHPQDALVQMHQKVCDPDLVTVCTRCGLAFPGQTKADLLVA